MMIVRSLDKRGNILYVAVRGSDPRIHLLHKKCSFPTDRRFNPRIKAWDDGGSAAPDQSTLIPLARMGAAHFVISRSTNAARYSGVWRSGAIGAAPISLNRSCTAG